MKNKRYCKVIDHCHYTRECSDAAYSMGNLKHCVPKNIPKAFCNVSNCDCHFIKKELVEKLKKQFTYLRENTKNYINLIKMEKKLKNISYIVQFIDSVIFMISPFKFCHESV